METGGPCGALIERARADMTVLREAEFAVLETVMELIANGAAAAGGYRSTERLLEDLWRVDRSHAKRLVAGAEQLCERVSFTGEPLPALMPGMSAVCAEGVAGREHVAVVVAAMRRIAALPHLEPTQVATEAILAGATRTLAPAQVVRVARRLMDQLDPDGAAPVDPDEPTDVLHLVRQRRDGALALGGLFEDRANAELIVEALDALRPGRPGRRAEPGSASGRSVPRVVRPGAVTDRDRHRRPQGDPGPGPRRGRHHRRHHRRRRRRHRERPRRAALRDRREGPGRRE